MKIEEGSLSKRAKGPEIPLCESRRGMKKKGGREVGREEVLNLLRKGRLA